jgi:DNA-binding transcriptional ArsR family regulator
MHSPATRLRKTKAKAAMPEAMRPHAEHASELLKALANEQRLMILCNLSGTEMSVSELNERLPLSQSALSQHLAVLREAGIVQTRRDAQTVHYSLADGPAAQVVETLHRIYCA